MGRKGREGDRVLRRSSELRWMGEGKGDPQGKDKVVVE